MNGAMALILAAIICTSIIIRLQPPLMRQLADYLNARADAENWFEKRHAEYKQQREDHNG